MFRTQRWFIACLAVLVGVCMLLPTQAQAQKVTAKVVAMSPGMLGTYPAGTFPVSTGLKVVGKGTKVYLQGDTTGAVTSMTWEFLDKPTGSAAAFSDAASWKPTFVPDLVGKYVLRVMGNAGAGDTVTMYANTYMGNPATGMGCGTCHPTTLADWKNTAHATIFTRGITGQLEVEEYEGQKHGVYNTTCIKCHTTGWEPNIDNGNYGFEAKKSGFDTLWYKIGRLVSGEYVMPYADSTSYNLLMTAPFAPVAKVASIGCESCHGAGLESHAMGAVKKGTIGVSFEAGACLQCHDAPNKHRLGSYWKASNHATMKLSAEEASRSACWPCHSGAALPDYLKNRATPDYTKTPIVASISCVTCHDPHSDANPNQLRTVTLDKLANGYAVPVGVGGKGQLCMNCHRARTDAKVVVDRQSRVFGDRFYPHYSPQADMYLGSNGFEYNLNIQGLGTHQHLEDGCVTCHMATRTVGSSVHSNHEMKMTDANGKDIVTACQNCHGKDIKEFNEVRAFNDYDGNGKVEGIVTEIDGLLARLRAILPQDATGEPVNMRVDSMKVKNDPNWPKNLPAIWNYYYVKNDWSKGIHNTKYAVALLRASLGTLVGVEAVNQDVPKNFSLSQNYPNPFNPSTTVQFSVPRAGTATLYVYNSAGALVAKLADGMLSPGNYTATWNGRDLNGVNVPSGVYYYRLSVTDNGASLFTATKKMMLVK